MQKLLGGLLVLASYNGLQASNWALPPSIYGASLESPLIHAVRMEKTQNVEKLLQEGASAIEQTGPLCLTPLMIAVASGYEAIAQLLVKTDPSTIEQRAKYGKTALMCAAQNGRTRIVEQLLDAGKSTLDTQDCDGFTALMFAAQMGYNETVKTLLKTGADATLQAHCKITKHTNTALSFAIDNKHFEVAKELCKHLKEKNQATKPQTTLPFTFGPAYLNS